MHYFLQQFVGSSAQKGRDEKKSIFEIEELVIRGRNMSFLQLRVSISTMGERSFCYHKHTRLQKYLSILKMETIYDVPEICLSNLFLKTCKMNTSQPAKKYIASVSLV